MMSNSTRTVLPVLMACVAGFSNAALAQEVYPNKPVTVVNPFTPGGPIEREFRMYTVKLQQQLGQPFILDFKPGAAGTVGAAFVARARPDGYTLLNITTSLTGAPALYPDLTFDVIKDFATFR